MDGKGTPIPRNKRPERLLTFNEVYHDLKSKKTFWVTFFHLPIHNLDSDMLKVVGRSEIYSHKW